MGADGDRIGGVTWVTLAAMTLSSSMILVDQTAVPLTTPDVIAGLILNAEQTGLKNLLEHTRKTTEIRVGVEDLIQAHVSSFELMFLVGAGIALLGALTSFVLVRRGDRVAEGPIFSRRSRLGLHDVGAEPGDHP